MFANETAAEIKKGFIFMKPFTVLCVPAETRTLDPLIKSQLLYQLSYGDMGCKSTGFVLICIFILKRSESQCAKLVNFTW